MEQPGRQRILDALVRLLELRPLDDIRVGELIREAQVNRSTYYYHFESVEDVAEQLMGEFVEQYRESYASILSRSDNSFDGAVDAALEMARFVHDRQEIVRVLLGSSLADRFRMALVQVIEEQCATYTMTFADETGAVMELKPDLYEYHLSSWAYQSVGTLDRWARRGFKETPEEYVEALRMLEKLHLVGLSVNR